MRRLLIPLVAAVALLGAAQPAAPPDHPVKFIKVDVLKKQLDAGEKVTIFDVRTADAYAELHIKGAKNLPLRQVEARATAEVPKNSRVVLY
jgi:3-mercaptopyruvate sulfurtransferase SseA